MILNRMLKKSVKGFEREYIFSRVFCGTASADRFSGAEKSVIFQRSERVAVGKNILSSEKRRFSTSC